MQIKIKYFIFVLFYLIFLFVQGYLENKYELLGYYIYDYEGNPSQSFAIKVILIIFYKDFYLNQTKKTSKQSEPRFFQASKSKGIPIQKVLLEIVSNWGNLEYTCVYRFRVHGKIFENVKNEEQLPEQNHK